MHDRHPFMRINQRKGHGKIHQTLEKDPPSRLVMLAMYEGVMI